MGIYHDNQTLDDLRVNIDVALCAYLEALGFAENDITDFDFSEFDESINNFGVK